MGRGTADGNNLEAVSTLKGLHRDKFHLGATFHPRWRRLPFSEQSQPALFITGVISLGDGWLARLSRKGKRGREGEREGDSSASRP